MDYNGKHSSEKIPRVLVFLTWFHKWPRSLRALLYACMGSAVLLTPGLIDYFFYLDVKDSNGKSLFDLQSSAMIGNYSLFSWSVYFSVIWAVLVGINYFITVLPAMILRIVDLILGKYYVTLLRPRLEYISQLHGYLALIFTSVVAIVFRAVAFQEQDQIFSNILTCFLIVSILLFVEKFILQMIAVGFHRKAFSERMIKSQFTAHVIELLNEAKKSIRARESGSASPNAWWNYVRSGSTPEKRSLKSPRSPSDLSKNSFNGSSVELLDVKIGDTEDNNGKKKISHGKIFKKSFNWVNTITEVTGVNAIMKQTKDIVKDVTKAAFDTIIIGASSDTDLQTTLQAESLATEIFSALSGGASEITVEDFLPFFASKEEADDAFKMFDLDESGVVALDEMKTTFVDYSIDKRAIEHGLRDLCQTVGKLDNILLIVATLIALLSCLSVFNVSIQSYLLTAGSMVVAASFVIGNSAKSVFESIIFIFVFHPYDVGDRIMIDNQVMIVKNMELTTSVFLLGNGQEVYTAHSVLSLKTIHNFRRSKNQSEGITIQFPLATPQNTIDEILLRMNEYVSKYPREFVGPVTMYVEQIKDRDIVEAKAKIVITIYFVHKGNWQDMGQRTVRRNKFIFQLKDVMNELKVYPTLTEDEEKIVLHRAN